MTFTSTQQPNHDRAQAARTANTPWRKTTTRFDDERDRKHRRRRQK